LLAGSQRNTPEIGGKRKFFKSTASSIALLQPGPYNFTPSPLAISAVDNERTGADRADYPSADPTADDGSSTRGSIKGLMTVDPEESFKRKHRQKIKIGGVREKSRQMIKYVHEQRAARTLSIVVGVFILW
jgi:hypothetical protein